MTVIKCTVSPEEKHAWKAYCQSLGLSESDALRRFIRRESKKNTPENVSETTGKSDNSAPKKELRTGKITVNLSPSALDTLHARMAKEGYATPTAWANACLMSVLKKDPVITKEEISALRDSCRQLAAVGRNLNQLVRVLQRYPDETRKVTPQTISKITDETVAHIAASSALITKVRERFSIKRRPASSTADSKEGSGV